MRVSVSLTTHVCMHTHKHTKIIITRASEFASKTLKKFMVITIKVKFLKINIETRFDRNRRAGV